MNRGFLRPSDALRPPVTPAKVVTGSPQEVITWKTRQETNKVKNREEIKLEEIRRMPLYA